MAREFARIRVSIAEDEDLEELSPAAQWLYFRVMIPDPSLNLAGVLDWRPTRLLSKARGLTLEYILHAAAELEQAGYVYFDVATEEAMVRTRMRSDEVLRNPKTAIGVVSAARSTTSKTLRAAVVSELRKAKLEHPDYTSWTSPISSEGLSQLLARRPIEEVGYTNQISNPNSNGMTNPDRSTLAMPVGPIGNGITNQITDGNGDPVGNPDRSDSTRDWRLETGDKNTSSPTASATVRYSDDFEQWWAVYPRKVGKGAASKAFDKAVRKTSASDLVSVTERYAAAVAAAGTEQRYIPHPSTWLNEDRFEDAPPTATDSAEPPRDENGLLPHGWCER